MLKKPDYNKTFNLQMCWPWIIGKIVKLWDNGDSRLFNYALRRI